MVADYLIVFVKNPIPGQVKTRIARTVGADKATDVYRHLLSYTKKLVQAFPGQCIIYYSDFINPDDDWNGYIKCLQTGEDLGERMSNAFRDQFGEGAQKVVIIGSDCLDVTLIHLQLAFNSLIKSDVVIGPASDGGYYLLGMNRFYPFLFENMPWSQPELEQLTELAILQHNLTFSRLEELTDIDEWVDYEQYMARNPTTSLPE